MIFGSAALGGQSFGLGSWGSRCERTFQIVVSVDMIFESLIGVSKLKLIFVMLVVIWLETIAELVAFVVSSCLHHGAGSQVQRRQVAGLCR